MKLPARLARTRLHTKLAAILTCVGLVGFAGVVLLLAAIITPSFDRLEQEAVAGHIDRTRVALEEYASKVEIAVKDYGVWDDSYAYMYAPESGAKFVEAVFSVLAFTNLDINGMAYVAGDGHVVYSRYVDLEAQADDKALRPDFDALIRSQAVARFIKARESGHFYARLGDKVVAVGIAHVFKSDGSGESPGFVIMARQITSEQLSKLIQLDAKFGLGRAHQPTAVRTRDATLDIAVDIDGLNRVHIANATFVVPRDFTLLGRRMLLFAGVGTAVLIAVILLALRQIIGRMVISPLARVERHMQGVSASGHLHPLVEAPRQDEIGALVGSFNTMLAQLKDLREQVEIQSFRLGQSESAIGVMHNVRNGLNPISVIVSQGINAAPVVAPADVARALGELAREDISAVRRQKLAAFLTAAMEADRGEAARRRDDMTTARDCLNNVLEIIGQQQAMAHERIDTQPCDIVEVLQSNAALARYAATGPIAFDCPEAGVAVEANRILLSQVVGNLFANAVESITATGRADGAVAVSINLIDRADGGAVEIRIRDNGEGFDPALGQKMFQRGFSSRKQKAGGLGLHWCANSINAMQGTLALVSAGPGQGATAIITLRAADPPPAERDQPLAA